MQFLVDLQMNSKPNFFGNESSKKDRDRMVGKFQHELNQKKSAV